MLIRISSTGLREDVGQKAPLGSKATLLESRRQVMQVWVTRRIRKIPFVQRSTEQAAASDVAMLNARSTIVGARGGVDPAAV